MPTNHRERLAAIRGFDQLIGYLRDELGWKIESDNFEEHLFEYTPEELGIDAKNAAKIQEIKRLRPLVHSQPWGIFFIKFEPKRLPVVALRRILDCVTRKQSGHPAWTFNDLLFLSNYGNRDRSFSFVHFSRPENERNLPTIKVFGWDSSDTSLHLDGVVYKLHEHLTWPDNENDQDIWRKRWRAAFTQQHREVITTSKKLSERLAELARAIRNDICAALEIESESGPLTKLRKDIQVALINDLDDSKFADMYAQTITYGLLSVRITNPEGTTDDLTAHMQTNPLLKEMMDAFLHVDRRGDEGESPRISFDELGISEVVELLNKANMEAVIRDFGDRNPQEDPVIHFYEHFLAAYNKKEKVERGVFYTPRPAVSYIVRSVDEILRSDFGLNDGLADITTWGEMKRRHKNLKIPEGVLPKQVFVQILDPATGTGTFLVEVIDLIHGTMVKKWKQLGDDEKKIKARWNDYVPRHLLPRLHGYELLMAPYAIAHLKIRLKLYETGYNFESDERARVYLTNALEPANDTGTGKLKDILPALAHEVQAVNQIKREQRFTVVLGNPPYLGEAGRSGAWIAKLMHGEESASGRSTFDYFKVDGEPLNERNPKWVNDLYVRFTRVSQWLLEQAGFGIHGFITNHGYISNSPTFRGMRQALFADFDRLFVLDLHGNVREAMPDNIRDKNIFDIKQGVAISLFVKVPSVGNKISYSCVNHADCWGPRKFKYEWLLAHDIKSTDWSKVEPRPIHYLLKPFENTGAEHYERWISVSKIFPENRTGVRTTRDKLTIDFDDKGVWSKVTTFARLSEKGVREHFNLPSDGGDWRFNWALKDVKDSGPSKCFIKSLLYRPFDKRSIYYTGKTRGFIGWPVIDIMGHMLAGENVGLIFMRQVTDGAYTHFGVSRYPVEGHYGNKDITSFGPLYLYPEVGKQNGTLLSCWSEGRGGRIPNLNRDFVEKFAAAINLQFVSDGRGDLRNTFGPEDIFAYIYAVFHSPCYRKRYESQLKLGFPRVPLPGNAALFRKLAAVGQDLLAIHLLEAPELDSFITTYINPAKLKVSRVGWSDGTVWIDAGKTSAKENHRATKAGTIGFSGVPEKVWDFHIGGHQVCHKWLKDRKGRTLSDEDVVHYQKIILALSKTICIMDRIDEIIKDCGGWPDAFRYTQ